MSNPKIPTKSTSTPTPATAEEIRLHFQTQVHAAALEATLHARLDGPREFLDRSTSRHSLSSSASSQKQLQPYMQGPTFATPNDPSSTMRLAKWHRIEPPNQNSRNSQAAQVVDSRREDEAEMASSSSSWSLTSTAESTWGGSYMTTGITTPAGFEDKMCLRAPVRSKSMPPRARVPASRGEKAGVGRLLSPEPYLHLPHEIETTSQTPIFSPPPEQLLALYTQPKRPPPPPPPPPSPVQMRLFLLRSGRSVTAEQLFELARAEEERLAGAGAVERAASPSEMWMFEYPKRFC